MKKIPFKVTARAAKLLGSDNIPNTETAFSEIIKNSYDAIANKCEIATFGDQEFVNQILIADNGHGMDTDDILEKWMMIGTESKTKKFSARGRTFTGAKGIGRFALDRLGGECIVFTKKKNNKEIIKWTVSWDDFEKKDTSLGDVYAYYGPVSVDEFLKEISVFEQTLGTNNFKTGTFIIVKRLRDQWNTKRVSSQIGTLRGLVPPKSVSGFSITFYNHLKNDLINLNEDLTVEYDYKLSGKLVGGVVQVKLHRDEFDKNKLIKSGYNKTKLAKKDDFLLKNKVQFGFARKLTITQLFERSIGKAELVALEGVGDFSFTLYYSKRQKRGELDEKKFLYKDFDSHDRKRFLDSFGGIKIFRDNFRIRPYGELNNAAFDWLQLGEIAATSPASPTHSTQQWKVRPGNIFGSINISRIENPNLDDISNRQGMHENVYFDSFKQILRAIISVFERDRRTVMTELLQLYNVNHQSELRKEEAETLIKKSTKQKRIAFTSEEGELLLERISTLQEEKEELTTELQLLDSLASQGLLLSTFAHELQNVSLRYPKRMQNLTTLIKKSMTLKSDLKSFDNPFVLLEEMKEDDQKVRAWLNLALENVKLDKRRRKKINLISYLRKVERLWQSILTDRDVDFSIEYNESSPLHIRAFEIDLDSIVNNLFTNSIEALEMVSGKRVLRMSVSEKRLKTKSVIIFTCSDSGAGLDPSIDNPERIFEPLFSTKTLEDRKEGIGLGLWIVKRVVDSYKGKITIEQPTKGFKLKIELPNA